MFTYRFFFTWKVKNGDFWGLIHQICAHLRLGTKPDLVTALCHYCRNIRYYPLCYHADLLAIKEFSAEMQTGIS